MNTGTVSLWLSEFVWQSTLCLCLGAGLSLLWKQWPARGHRVLVLALAACFVTPVLTHVAWRNGWGVIPARTALETAGNPSVPTPALPPPGPPAALAAATAAPAPAEAGPGTSTAAGVHADGPRTAATARFAWGTWMLLGWLVLSAFALARLLVGIVREILVLRGADAVIGAEACVGLQRAVARLGVKDQPRVLSSSRVASPVICCWGSRPVILVPAPPPQSWQAEAWAGIFIHELAHWKRRDHYSAMLAELVLCCLPWHPLVWWVRRRLDQLSESACDGWVVAAGQPAELYAGSLLDLVPQRTSAVGLPALGTKTRLQRRIRRILSGSHSAISPGGPWAWGAAGVALLLVGTIAVAQPRSRAAQAGWQLSGKAAERAASGLNLRLMVKGWASDFSGCPSADGRYVCDLDRDRDWELCVRDRVSGKSRLLTKDSEKAGGEPGTGLISPDNRYVVYDWTSTNSGWANELRLARLDGSGTRLLYRSGDSNNVWALQWSADGKKILAAAWKEAEGRLLLISVADGSAEVLKTLPPGRSYAGLSPDGRYVAFNSLQRGSTNACDVFLYDLREKRDLPLVTHPADDRFLGWSLDGKWVLFSSDRWSTIDLWAVQVADGKAADAPRMIKSNLGEIDPKGFTRDGSFYYSRSFHACDVYTASMDLQTGHFLEAPVPLPFLGDKALPAWSHNGQSLAYLRLRKEGEMRALSTLVIYVPATGVVRELDPGGLGYYSWKCPGLYWSLDDRFILADGYDKDSKGHVYQINIQSGRTSLVADKPENGKPLVFAPDADPEALKMLRAAEAARQKALEVNSEARHAELSPDGQSVAFDTGWQSPKIMLIPAAGGTARELVPEQPGLLILQICWTPDSQSLLYVARDKKFVTSLWKIPVRGGTARRLWVTNPTLGHLAIHPDGRRLALSGAATLQHEVWVLEHFLPQS